MRNRRTMHLFAATAFVAAPLLFVTGASASPGFADRLGVQAGVEKVACWWEDGERFCDNRGRWRNDTRREWRRHGDYYGYGHPRWRDRDHRWRDDYDD